MQVLVDPTELRYTASCFFSGAYDLREKAKRIEDILNSLIHGKDKWSGEASQAFTTKMEELHSELQQKAGILDEAVQILNQFALQMDHVYELRNQANQLEHTLWSITGDSEASFHERQSISFQINQLQQEAEWQANAADAQATSAFNSLSIPMPDFSNGMSHKGSLESELEGLPEKEKSYFRRHKDLISGFDENDSESKDQPLDRANMNAAMVQYLKSKEPDYLPDDIREKVAMQDFNMMYADLPDDVLAAKIQEIANSEKQAQHFQQEIQSGNYDQNALIHEHGYTQYAMNQAYQQDPLGGMQGILLGMGLTKAFSNGEGQTPKIMRKNTDESQDETSKEVIDGNAQVILATEDTGEVAPVGKSSATTRLKATKLSSEKIELDWLPDKYTAVEVNGFVKVAGKEVDVSRRVYQIEIDKNYVPEDPGAGGLTNVELMAKGKSPYVVNDGVESKVELHHLIQKEPGGMVEIAEVTHDKYSSSLHGLVEDGNSFRNDPVLEKKYNNFRSNYWKMRANE